MNQFSQIETARLTLRPLHADDRVQVVSLLNDLDVTRWLTVVPHPYGDADFDGFLAYLTDVPLEGLAIEEDGVVLGVVGLGDTLGYWLGRAHHGRGVMSEAARGLLDYAFDVLGRGEIESGYFRGNGASRAVLTKLGFAPTGKVVTEHCVSEARDKELIKMRLCGHERP